MGDLVANAYIASRRCMVCNLAGALRHGLFVRPSVGAGGSCVLLTIANAVAKHHALRAQRLLCPCMRRSHCNTRCKPSWLPKL